MRVTEKLSPKAKNIVEVCKCMATFILIAMLLLLGTTKLTDTRLIFAVLLLTGWLSWTFTEYALHRFWMHNYFKTPGNKLYDSHMNHHKHPRDIRISATHRILTFTGMAILLPFSIYLNNYFTVFTGFYLGFMFYSMLHVILHKPWSKYIMPNLQKAHIHHHGKYPNMGYSFSMIFWDWMFGTLPPKNAKITKKMLEFYFKEEDHDHLLGKKFLM